NVWHTCTRSAVTRPICEVATATTSPRMRATSGATRIGGTSNLRPGSGWRRRVRILGRRLRTMLKPGDVVWCDFVGAQGVKRRPAVVISSDLYHSNRIDAVVGELTTQLAKASQPTSYQLQDWSAAGLQQASVFRCYFSM